jgi:cytochrome oxidase assembly protein ShyY1
MLSDYYLQQSQPPVSITTLSSTELDNLPDYQRISAVGKFDNEHSWLIDNKIRQGKVGYELVQAFVINKELSVLVNRGWVPAPRLRTDLPEFPLIDGPLTLFASTKRYSENALLLAAQPSSSWPRVSLQVDPALAGRELATSFSNHILYIDALSEGALVTDWKTINIQPEKHTGYAVQWFAMAFVLVIWYCFASSNLMAVMKQTWGKNE